MGKVYDESEITLEVLQLFRDFMSAEQIERYGEYLAHKIPSNPFTGEEVNELHKKRESFLDYYRHLQEQILENHNRK
jgi:hypothetical protein